MNLWIVQARMGSNRLPGKVMKELNDSPMILYTLNRLKRSNFIDCLVLATSTLPEDDVLAERVQREGFEVFRGHGANVLKRYADCCREYGGTIVVRVTGDCPLIDPSMIDYALLYRRMHDLDYASTQSIRGLDTEVMTAAALFLAEEKADEDKYTEHVTSYMYTHPRLFKVGHAPLGEAYQKPYRLCVDEEADFEVVKRVISAFGEMHCSDLEVIRYLDAHPDLASYNRHVKQKKLGE